MRIKSNTLGVIVLIVIFGGIVASSVFNMWNTSSTKVPVQYQSGDFKGEYDPSDIRGSYTLGDINNSFNVSVETLAKAFGVENTGDIAGFQLKNLESIYADLKTQGKDIGTGSVRLFVGLYTGLPVELDEGIFLPRSAAEILTEKGNLSEEQLTFVKSHTVELPNDMQKQSDSNASNAENVQTEDARIVKGKTTFYEVISWGVKKEKVEELIGGQIPSQSMTISDYCRQNGISFSPIKDSLNNLIDK